MGIEWINITSGYTTSDNGMIQVFTNPKWGPLATERWRYWNLTLAFLRILGTTEQGGKPRVASGKRVWPFCRMDQNRATKTSEGQWKIGQFICGFAWSDILTQFFWV